jgi:ATP-binding cassette subfamily B protein
MISTLCNGDFFGEIALVTDVPRTATVTAATPIRALVVPTREFRQLLRTSPDIQGKVLQAVAERVAALL